MKKIIICAVAFIGVLTASASLITVTNESSSPTKSEQIGIYRECRSCDGKGYIVIKKQCTCSYLGGNPDCSKCGGDGVIETQHTCNTCKGKGKVKVN